VFTKATCFDITGPRQASTRDGKFKREIQKYDVPCLLELCECFVFFLGKSQIVKYSIMLTDIYISLCQMLLAGNCYCLNWTVK